MNPMLKKAVFQNTIALDTFFYTVPNFVINNGETLTNFLKIESDTDFLIRSTSMSARIQAGIFEPMIANWTNNPFVVDIVDMRSGEHLMNKNDTWGNVLFGSKGFQFVWPEPKLVLKDTMLAISITDTGTTNFWNVNITFHGQKIYRKGV